MTDASATGLHHDDPGFHHPQRNWNLFLRSQPVDRLESRSATLDTIGSNANVDTYSPGVYMSYANSGWYFNALASYGFASYSQGRNVNIGAFNGTAHSSPGGDQILANLDGGCDFHKGHWTFGPTIGLQYVHLNVDGYTETGLPGADLAVNRDQSDSLRSRIGGELSYAIKSDGMIFTPHLSASWQHDFMDQNSALADDLPGLSEISSALSSFPCPRHFCCRRSLPRSKSSM